MENHPLLLNTNITVGSRRRSNKGVNSNMPTNLDKKDLAKTMEGARLCTNTKKGDSRICSNNRTIALISHASKVMLKVIQHRLDHGARNCNRTGRFHERKRYTRSNIKFTMDNGKVDRISQTNICICDL